MGLQIERFDPGLFHLWTAGSLVESGRAGDLLGIVVFHPPPQWDLMGVGYPSKNTNSGVDELYATACGMKFAPDFIDNEAYSVSDHLIGLNLDRVVVLKGTIDEKSDAQRKKLTRRKKIE
ncbi:hypothetical protein E8E15_007930 [Penicillium rubens]|jgi:hypothetical protein|nr:hypothetical protein E8E15_007930 [Penicillium rubens]